MFAVVVYCIPKCMKVIPIKWIGTKDPQKGKFSLCFFSKNRNKPPIFDRDLYSRSKFDEDVDGIYKALIKEFFGKLITDGYL